MSDNGRPDINPEDPRFPLDPELVERLRDQLGEQARERINNTLSEQRIQLENLRQELSEIRTERDQLRQRVDTLQAQLAEMTEGSDEGARGQTFHMADVFEGFATAVEDTQQTLVQADKGYEIGNMSVNLRANVVSDEEGLRLRFPESLRDQNAGLTSEFDFTLQPRSPDESSTYEEIPSVVGQEYETAKRTIDRRGFESTVVERRAGEQPDVVLEQFPSPRSLAEPGTVIDLVVSHQSESDTESTEETERDTPERSGDQRVGEVLEGEAGSLPVSAIQGIGQTYASRLQEAGIASLEALVNADPREIAEITNASRRQAAEWIERAREALNEE